MISVEEEKSICLYYESCFARGPSGKEGYGSSVKKEEDKLLFYEWWEEWNYHDEDWTRLKVTVFEKLSETEERSLPEKSLKSDMEELPDCDDSVWENHYRSVQKVPGCKGQFCVLEACGTDRASRN